MLLKGGLPAVKAGAADAEVPAGPADMPRFPGMLQDLQFALNFESFWVYRRHAPSPIGLWKRDVSQDRHSQERLFALMIVSGWRSQVPSLLTEEQGRIGFASGGVALGERERPCRSLGEDRNTPRILDGFCTFFRR